MIHVVNDELKLNYNKLFRKKLHVIIFNNFSVFYINLYSNFIITILI